MEELNHAIAIFVGKGLNAYPKRDDSRVLEAYGPIEGAALMALVRPLFAEVDQITPNWNDHDLVSGSQWVIDQLAERHPELDNEGKAALLWDYSFNNR